MSVAERAGLRERGPLVLRVLAAVFLSFLAISAVAGAALAGLEGVEEANSRLAALDTGWVVLALGIWATSLVVQGFRWRALLAVRERPPGLVLGQVLFGSNVLNLALPGPVGELAAAGYARHRFGVPMLTALAATLVSRLLALTIFGLFTLLLWPFVAPGLPAEMKVWLTPLTLAVGLTSVPLVLVCWKREAAVNLVGRLVGLLLRGERLARLQARMVWWARCFAAVGGVGAGRWLQAAGWCVANLLILTLSTLCTLRAAGIEADPVGTLFMQAFTAVVSVAGVLLPGGLGAVELAVVMLFPTFAHGNTADAVFCAMVLRWVHLLTLVMGIPWMVWLVATLPGRAEQLVPLLQGVINEEG